jgi:hypothetical protein
MDIDSYGSAEAEALLRAAQSRRKRRVPIGHEALAYGIATAGFLGAAVAVAAVAPSTRPFSLAVFLLTVAVYATALSVRFPVGSVWANPTQLVFVPMLFVLPTSIVPAAVGLAMLLARAADLARGRITPRRPSPASGSASDSRRGTSSRRWCGHTASTSPSRPSAC